MVKIALDAQACLALGECLVITNNQYYIFIAIFIVAGLLLLILFLTAFMTPALIFLKAKLTKADIIYSVNRGQGGRFLIAQTKFQGIADVKGVGPFIISENSHTVEKKSKMQMYFAFGEFAATLPIEFAQVVQYLRDTKHKINHIEDLADIIGMKFDIVKKTWDKIPEDKLTEDQKKKIDELEVEITPYKTIKIHEMANMFPFNITPALVESKTQHMIALKMSMFNKMTPQLVMMFIMILMGSTLAAVIAFKFLQSGDVSSAPTIIERVVQTVPVVGNLTG